MNSFFVVYMMRVCLATLVCFFTQKEEVKLPQAPPLLFFLCLFDSKSSYALTGTNSTSTAGPAPSPSDHEYCSRKADEH